MNVSDEDQKLIAQTMDNSSLAMDEERLSLFGIRALCDTERECAAAFADGQVTSQEAIRIFRKLAVVGSTIQAQLETGRKDVALGREICSAVVKKITGKEGAALADGSECVAAQL